MSRCEVSSQMDEHATLNLHNVQYGIRYLVSVTTTPNLISSNLSLGLQPVVLPADGNFCVWGQLGWQYCLWPPPSTETLCPHCRCPVYMPLPFYTWRCHVLAGDGGGQTDSSPGGITKWNLAEEELLTACIPSLPCPSLPVARTGSGEGGILGISLQS